MPYNGLKEIIASRSATVGVMGLGYVGLPLALECARAGYRTIGVDINEARAASVQRGESHVGDVSSDDLAAQVTPGRLTATANARALQECDAVLICVPTPLNKTKEPDVSFIIGALKEVVHYLRRDQLIILESTTYPGFTREVCLPTLEEGSGYVCGKDFFLTFSPERTDPGNEVYKVHNTTKVLGGVTAACSELAKQLYGAFIEKIHVVSSPDAAEMSKLLENTFRAVNIGLVNEVALMCHTLGIDTWEVIEAASTKPFGFMPFYPGPGLGGHCIPVDPLYLSWKLRSHNYTARFVELAQTINAAMPQHVVQMASDALNEQAKAVRGSKIVVMGVAYKPDIDDIRESPALEIIGMLSRKGATVVYHDPYVERAEIDGQEFRSVALEDALVGADLVVITTDHTMFDLGAVAKHAPLILDTRNAMSRADLTDAQKAKIRRL